MAYDAEIGAALEDAAKMHGGMRFAGSGGMRRAAGRGPSPGMGGSRSDWFFPWMQRPESCSALTQADVGALDRERLAGPVAPVMGRRSSRSSGLRKRKDGDMGRIVTDLEKLKLAANSLICSEPPSAVLESIRGYVDELRPSFPTVTDEEAQALVHELESIHSVTMKPAAFLQAPGLEPWLEEARSRKRGGNGPRPTPARRSRDASR